jgi:hypothetical protein
MSTPGVPLAVTQVVARNIAPLAGIVFFGWSAQNALLLYFVDTLLALGVLFAGLLRHFAPPIENDGWAARANTEVGVLGGAAFLALFFAIPLGVPLIFMLGGRFDGQALWDDSSLVIGLAWQVAAAIGSYVELYRALRTSTPEQLKLKRRFALVFLRWVALVMLALLGIGIAFGRHSALAFVALYAAISIWAEVAPDHFLRAMPGSDEDAQAPAGAQPRLHAQPRRSTQPPSAPPRRRRRR